MSLDERNVLLIGGPDAGKSNYLFRFWLATDPRMVPAPIVTRNGLPEDLSHLNLGVSELLQGRFAGHTPQDTSATCRIPVNCSGQHADLVVPDRPGEDWVGIYQKRRWPQAWTNHVGDSTSFLIFIRVHSEVNVDNLNWISVQRMLGPGANLNPDQTGIRDLQDQTPTQVMVVDWMQMLVEVVRRRSGSRVRPRIGIVITAWDLLHSEEQHAGPSAYLREQFCLVHDFIFHNRDRLDCATFGVSILGGDLEDEEHFREEYLDTVDKSRLGSVWHELGTSPAECSDLTLPVAWALGIDGTTR